MFTQPVKISVSKIKIDNAYYPRVEPDESRIKEFIEAMECGEYFSPIKVVKHEDQYILLDGLHRLKSMILRNEDKILADIMNIQKEHWLLAAARFNVKSSKPLTYDEIKQVIIKSWRNGLKDTTEIAEEMGYTVRYVEKIIKPIRDEKRLEQKKKILSWNKKGLNQRQIAKKAGISPSCVNKIINKEKIKQTIKCFQNEQEFVLETFKQQSVNTDKLNTRDKNIRAFFDVTTGNVHPAGIVPGKEKNSRPPDSASRHPLDVSDKLRDNASKEPCPSYIDQIPFYGDLSEQHKHAVRALELVKYYKQDLVDIMDVVNEPLNWLKKVLTAAITLSLMKGEPSKKIAGVSESTDLPYETIRVIKNAIPFGVMLRPIGPHMVQWCKDNLSQKDMNIISKESSIQKSALPFLLKGETPPVKKSGYKVLPDEYKKSLRSNILLYRELRDCAKKKKFQGDSAKQLLAYLNRNTIAINEIYEVLRDSRLV